MTATAGVELASQTYTATVTYTMFEPSQNVEATFNFPEIQVYDLTNGVILTTCCFVLLLNTSHIRKLVLPKTFRP